MIRARLDVVLELLALTLIVPAVWWHMSRRAEWPRSCRRLTPHHSTPVHHA